MATLLEQVSLWQDPTLSDRVRGALAVKAADLLNNTPSLAQAEWAVNFLNTPNGIDQQFLRFLIGANPTLSIAQLQGVADTAIQTAVDNAVDAIIGAV